MNPCYFTYALALFLFVSCSKQQEDESIEVNKSLLMGTVVNENQVAVPGAEVKIYATLKDWENEEKEVEILLTDENGRFELTIPVTETKEYFLWIQKNEMNNWPVGINFDKRVIGDNGLMSIFGETIFSTILTGGETTKKTIQIAANSYHIFTGSAWKQYETFNGRYGNTSDCDTSCAELRLTKSFVFVLSNSSTGHYCTSVYKPDLSPLMPFNAGTKAFAPEGDQYYMINKTNSCGTDENRFFINKGMNKIVLRSNFDSDIKNYEVYKFFEMKG